LPHDFVVLLGSDKSGKSSVMAEIARSEPAWRTLSTDTRLLAPEHGLIAELRRHVMDDVLPGLGRTYSAEFLAGLLQTAVLHLRDQLADRPDGEPVLMDSYYYKILAKCRLAGVPDNPMFAWWRSFPQPGRVVFLDASAQSCWRRSGNGERLNPLEYGGSRPTWPGYRGYQTRLRELMLEEVRTLPVTHIEEYESVTRTAQAVREVLAS